MSSKLKKGRAGVAEVEYVLNHRDDSVPDVASKLNRSEKFVQKILDENPVEVMPKAESPSETMTKVYGEDEKPVFDKKNILNRSAGGRKGITVMTPTASEQADKTRTERVTNNNGRFYDGSVHKPFGDE